MLSRWENGRTKWEDLRRVVWNEYMLYYQSRAMPTGAESIGNNKVNSVVCPMGFQDFVSVHDGAFKN